VGRISFAFWVSAAFLLFGSALWANSGNNPMPEMRGAWVARIYG